MNNYLLEGIVTILLSMTVIFCWRLNNKITEIKNSRKDMANLVKVFDEAIIKTNKSLGNLKEASADAALELKRYSFQSNELIKELAFMNDTAVRLADRLENVLLEAKEMEARFLNVIEEARIVNTKIKSNSKNINIKNNNSDKIVKPRSAKRNIHSLAAKSIDELKTQLKLAKIGSI